MNKKAQLQVFLNPKSLVYIFGFGILAYLTFNTILAAIVGGIIGAIIAFNS